MSIADELKTYVHPTGTRCGIFTLSQEHPDLYADLVEAMATTEASTVIARWWTDTREQRSGLHVSDTTVHRHRAKDCPACR
jgi:hypothetical protein